MYKCLECGNVFADDERNEWTEMHGEHMSGCPECGGAFEEACLCSACGGYFTQEELFGGLCADCLREKVTYDSGLKFMLDKDLFNEFMFCKFYECEDAPEWISQKLLDAMIETYQRMKADDLICSRETFLDLVKSFILDDDDVYGKDVFAEWLKNRGVK